MDRPAPTWKVKPVSRLCARGLRRNSTEAERRLWASLRDHRLAGHSLRRQVPINGFIADFVCHAAELLIELDGGQHFSEAGEASDSARTALLKDEGFRVLRFSNRDVLTNRDGVLETILAELAKSPHPSPPPQAGEGAGTTRG